MIDIVEHVKCCGCEACCSICKVSAIEMKQDLEGFFYPHLNAEKCISCNECETVCPILNKKKKKEELLKAFACYNKDEIVRKQSTSGGIFSVLAEYIIEQKKGIVYGVEFDEKFEVRYGKATDKKELEVFRGSKYVQSQIMGVYEEIQMYLEKGKYILFSGLPCQVEALRCFLKKEYNHLYLVDMICFGVGSPLIWKYYLNEFHKREKIDKIIFKDKKYGWKNWCVNIVEDGMDNYYRRKKNLYMNSYLQKINIRPSCFRCEFKGLHRNSDFTIADCWGIGESNVNLNDDGGLSALLLHTKKANVVFEAIKDKIVYEEYLPIELMEGNWATHHTIKENSKREDFFREWEKDGFRYTFLKYFGENDEV